MTTAQAETWAAIERSATNTRCRCTLRPAMSQTELRAFGGGCTMPAHCCPTLDTYRRRTPQDRIEATTTARAATPPEPERYDPFASQVLRG